MSDSDSSSSRPEPGRIARPSKALDQSGWSRWLPGLRTLREYQVAGCGTSWPDCADDDLVPVGIAYAVASGLPRHQWLYARPSPRCLLTRCSTQPDPGGGGPSRAAIILAFVLAAGGRRSALRAVRRWHDAGRVREPYASWPAAAPIRHRAFPPIRYSFMNGIALTLLINQLPKLFGLSVEGDGLISRRGPGQAVLDGRANSGAIGRRRHANGHPALQGQQRVPAI
jgi:hypothetical protein